MGTMKTFDPAEKFTPTDLVAPDGRPYTAESLPEFNELVAKGYAVAPTEPAVEPATVPALDDSAAALAADVPAMTDAAQALTDAPASTPDTTAAPVAKASARRDGGVK